MLLPVMMRAHRFGCIFKGNSNIKFASLSRSVFMVTVGEILDKSLFPLFFVLFLLKLTNISVFKE